jgi:hypothetical protein
MYVRSFHLDPSPRPRSSRRGLGSQVGEALHELEGGQQQVLLGSGAHTQQAMVATGLLDRLLHDAVVIPIEGNSYRLREHADLIPERLRARSLREPTPVVELKRWPRSASKRARRATNRLSTGTATG